jgi:hypothetical protein
MKFAMRLPCLLFLSAASGLVAAPPPPVWDAPAKIAPEELAAVQTKLEEASARLPAGLVPAVSMQRLLLKIRAGAPVAEWREPMAKFASSTENSPVAAGLRELAHGWEARARMTEVDRVLRSYYRNRVQFPASLADVKLPAGAQTDSWGDPWTYAPSAPKGFSNKFSSQRYTLAPSKHPQVRPVEDTLASPAPARTWKVAAREVAGQKVMEFRTAGGGVFATQAGGRVEDATVLHIDDGWALLADLERIFTVTY